MLGGWVKTRTCYKGPLFLEFYLQGNYDPLHESMTYVRLIHESSETTSGHDRATLFNVEFREISFTD